MRKSYQYGGAPKYQPQLSPEDIQYPTAGQQVPTGQQLQNSHGLSYQAVKPPFNYMGLGLGVQAATDALGEISGRVDRGRQNQYMYNQYSTLGQMLPMPAQNYQPNPYSLYAKMGGSLKRYMNYDKMFNNNAHMGIGDEGMHGEMQQGGYQKPNISYQQGQVLATRKQLDQGMSPYTGPISAVNRYVPPEIDSLDWDPTQQLPYFQDPQSGDMIHVPNSYISLPRFNKGQVQQMPQQLPSLTAKLQEGGIQEQSQINYMIRKASKYSGGLKRGGKKHPSHISPKMRQQQMMQQQAMQQQMQQGQMQQPGMRPDTDNDAMKSGGNWLKGAVNPAHKGFCTPMTKSTCTGHRRAFALMMKKKHGFHK